MGDGGGQEVEDREEGRQQLIVNRTGNYCKIVEVNAMKQTGRVF